MYRRDLDWTLLSVFSITAYVKKYLRTKPLLIYTLIHPGYVNLFRYDSDEHDCSYSRVVEVTTPNIKIKLNSLISFIKKIFI